MSDRNLSIAHALRAICFGYGVAALDCQPARRSLAARELERLAPLLALALQPRGNRIHAALNPHASKQSDHQGLRWQISGIQRHNTSVFS